MKPVPNWRRVLRHAWSVRVNVLIALGSAAASSAAVGPDRLLFAIVFLAQLGAVVARLIHQEKLN